MNGRRLDLILPAAIAVACAAALLLWLSATSAQNVKPRLPGEEPSLGLATKLVAGPINTGTTITGPGAPSATFSA